MPQGTECESGIAGAPVQDGGHMMPVRRCIPRVLRVHQSRRSLRVASRCLNATTPAPGHANALSTHPEGRIHSCASRPQPSHAPSKHWTGMPASIRRAKLIEGRHAASDGWVSPFRETAPRPSQGRFESRRTWVWSGSVAAGTVGGIGAPTRGGEFARSGVFRGYAP